MSDKLVGNAIVFTQGGPTAVINASWVGVVEGLADAETDHRYLGQSARY